MSDPTMRDPAAVAAMRAEWEGIQERPGRGRRPVMTRPPRPLPTEKFIGDVRHEIPDLADLGDDIVRAVAEWAIDKMERYAAAFATPVFEVDGIGPTCSFCGVVWPLCGHHLLSTDLPDDTDQETPDD